MSTTESPPAGQGTTPAESGLGAAPQTGGALSIPAWQPRVGEPVRILSDRLNGLLGVVSAVHGCRVTVLIDDDELMPKPADAVNWPPTYMVIVDADALAPCPKS